MKIIGIAFLVLSCLIIFSLVIDISQQFTIHEALNNAISPFRVMSIGETFTLWFLVFLFLSKHFISPGRTNTKRSRYALM